MPLKLSPNVILACGAVILWLSVGVRAGMGLYLQPLSLEYGWGREMFSFSFAIQNLVWGALGPFAGALADRYGAGRVIAASALLYMAGLVGMAYVDTPFAMHMMAGTLIGAGLAGTSFAIVFAVIARAVPLERRSFALGLATAAGSFGQFSLLPVTQFLISSYDWHMALVLTAGIFALTIPLAIAMAGTPATLAGPHQSIGAALHEAWRERGYHLIFWGFFVCGFHVAMITLHLPAFVADAGLRAEHGMTALALIGLFNIIGSISFGWLGGRLSKKYLLSTIYGLRVFFIGLLVFLPLSPLTLYLFACGMGLLWLSTVPLTNGLVSQIFGLRYAAMLAAIVFFGHQIGSFIGVWLAGFLYDSTGSYAGAFYISMALGVIAALLNLPINEKPLAERRAVAPA
jgi:MFS family permease